ncbi:MAG: DUF2784 domain-containing protein [Stellaceae bacterium]
MRSNCGNGWRRRRNRAPGEPITNPNLLQALALAVLAAHVAVIAFNLCGLIVVPLGAWRDWRWVRIRWWRALHLALLVVVALQALFGRACFLTLWQTALEQGAGETASRQPLIARWIDSVIFLNLPIWFFVALYVAVLIYALALWRLVPPTQR